MSSMSLGEAQHLLIQARDQAEGAAVMANALVEHFNQLSGWCSGLQQEVSEVKEKLGQVSAAGISPDRMPSTIGLANEIDRIQGEILGKLAELHNAQGEQHRRAFSLYQGIGELL